MKLNKIIAGGMLLVSLTGLVRCDEEKGINQIVDDFNNDKLSDLINVSYDWDSNPKTKGYRVSYDAYISLGESNGNFLSQKKVFHFELKPENIQVGDVNGDGNKDLLFIAYDWDSNPKTNGYTVSYDQYVALGNGDGTFQTPKKSFHYNIKPDSVK